MLWRHLSRDEKKNKIKTKSMAPGKRQTHIYNQVHTVLHNTIQYQYVERTLKNTLKNMKSCKEKYRFTKDIKEVKINDRWQTGLGMWNSLEQQTQTKLISNRHHYWLVRPLFILISILPTKACWWDKEKSNGFNCNLVVASILRYCVTCIWMAKCKTAPTPVH